MAYPPTVPPAGRLDGTALATNHPSDHNLISAALTDIINELGTNPKGDFASVQAHLAAICPIGAVLPYAGTTAPSGWGLADGGALSRVDNAELFALIGTTYGAGDGSTTFNKPDLRSRFIAGKGLATWSDALAETGGASDAIVVSHTHTGPAHTHTFTTGTNSVDHTHTYSNAAGTGGAGIAGGATFAGTVSNTGGQSSTHTHAGTTDSGGTGVTGSTGVSGTNANLPPYITLNFIIRVT